MLVYTRAMFRSRRGYRWILGRQHTIIAEALMRVYRGECKRLIINIPPRYSKTEMAVINFISWSLGHHPDAEFIYTSYSARLAANFSWQTRELVMEPDYQRLFPRTILRSDSKAKDEWRTTEGGIVYSAGTGGTITGYGAGKHREEFGGAIIVDDPLKPDEAKSDTIRGGVIDWFQNTLESRKNSPNTPIIVIMQRLHESDLAGWLLAGGNKEEWEHVCLPTPMDNGEALWPEKHSVDVLAAMEASNPYVFAGQYRQRPAPPEGGVFKPDNIETVDAIPAGITDTVRGWDFASTTSGDYTVGAKIAKLADGRFIILDVIRERLAVHARDALFNNTVKRDGYGVTTSIPQDPGQAGKSQVAYMIAGLPGYTVKSSPESGDKEVRAEPFAAQVNVGNVLMLRAPWNDDLVAEMRLFPNGNFDDQVDGCSRAFMELVGWVAPSIIWPDGPPEKSALGLPRSVSEMLAVRGEVRATCGGCGGRAGIQCLERGFTVREVDPACDLFFPAV